MSILCLLGRHKRSRRHAREEGLDLVSQCKRCGRPMRKEGDGRWVLARTDRASA